MPSVALLDGRGMAIFVSLFAGLAIMRCGSALDEPIAPASPRALELLAEGNAAAAREATLQRHIRDLDGSCAPAVGARSRGNPKGRCAWQTTLGDASPIRSSYPPSVRPLRQRLPADALVF